MEAGLEPGIEEDREHRTLIRTPQSCSSCVILKKESLGSQVESQTGEAIQGFGRDPSTLRR